MTRTAFTSTLTPSERNALIADAKRRAQALRRAALQQWGTPWLRWGREPTLTTTGCSVSHAAQATRTWGV